MKDSVMRNVRTLRLKGHCVTHIFNRAALLLLSLCGCLCGCDDRLGSGKPYVAFHEVSPNGKYLVEFVELEQFPDRNFEIRLTQVSTGEKSVIFKSPDEGKKGREEIFWSKDSSSFILTGTNFFVKPLKGITSSAGDVIYLFYSVPTAKLFCNASQGTYEKILIKDLPTNTFVSKAREIILNVDRGSER